MTALVAEPLQDQLPARFVKIEDSAHRGANISRRGRLEWHASTRKLFQSREKQPVPAAVDAQDRLHGSAGLSGHGIQRQFIYALLDIERDSRIENPRPAFLHPGEASGHNVSATHFHISYTNTNYFRVNITNMN